MPIAIVGAGRCGTSMVTRMLNICGMYIGGETEMFATGDFDNPRGYWEHRDVHLLNDRIIAHFNPRRASNLSTELGPRTDEWTAIVARRASLVRLPTGWENDPSLAPFYDEARLLIESRFVGRECWGWKDPSGSLTLPFWRKLIPDLKVILCVRNPIDGAQSIEKHLAGHALGHYHFAGIHGWMDWYYYNAGALAAVPPEDRILTHFEDYRRGYRDALSPVLQFAGLPEVDPGSDADRAIAEFYSPDLAHYAGTAEDVAGDLEIPEVVKRLYAAMRAGDDADLREMVRQASVIMPLAATIIEQHADAAGQRALSARATEFDATAEQLRSEVAALKSELRRLRPRSAEMEAILASRTHRLADRVCRLLIAVRRLRKPGRG